jgi:SAM-dependent methyltransferase
MMHHHDWTWDQVDPFDPGDRNLWMKAEHLGRYLFAADYLRAHRPRRVADVGCGIGYGLPELARACREVIGVDRDSKALEVARSRFAAPGMRLVRADAVSSDLLEEAGAVDAAVCFETLEHLADPGAALIGIGALLPEGGFLLCSVPNAAFESRDRAGLPENRRHRQLFTFDSVSRLLRERGFVVEYRLGQSWSNVLFRRETELVRREMIPARLGEEAALHAPEVIRRLSYVLAYPTAEDPERSYSMVLVARKAG